METFFIVNPTAGSGRAKESWKNIEEILVKNEIPYDVKFTKYRGHGIKIARKAARDGYKKIFSVGGDGTVNEVANGIILSKKSPTLGVIPVGTGNDFSKSLGIDCSIEKILLSNKTRNIDVALLKSRGKKKYFVNMSGIGFDSYVTKNIILRNLGGTIPYLTTVLISLFRYSPKKAIIIHDNGKFEQDIFMMSIANGNYIGGGMKISPFSKMDDGYLDVVIIPKISKFEILSNLSKIYSGKHIYHPKVQLFRTKKLHVGAKDLFVHVEGDVVAKTPVDISIAESKIKVIVPEVSH